MTKWSDLYFLLTKKIGVPEVDPSHHYKTLVDIIQWMHLCSKGCHMQEVGNQQHRFKLGDFLVVTSEYEL